MQVARRLRVHRSNCMRRLLPFLLSSAFGQVLAQEPEDRFFHDWDFGAEDSPDGHVHSSWDSRYSLEGRDVLDGDSLWSTSAELGWRYLVTGVWYGLSPDGDYEELQASAAFGVSAGDFEFYAGYTRFWYLSDDSDDNEVVAGLTWAGPLCGIEVSAEGYHSFEADGSFWEMALSREFEITEKLSITGVATFGVNQGYVSDGHDGANHLALELAAEYLLTDSLSLAAHLIYSWALDRDAALPGDELLTDFLHGGVGIKWEF